MNPRDRDTLRKNRVYLVKNMMVNEELLSFLQTKKILSEDMAEEVKVVQLTRSAKAGALLDILPRRGPAAFRGFVEGLVEADQGYISDMLDIVLANRYRESTGRPLEEPYPEDTPVHRELRPLTQQLKNTRVEDTESFIKFEIKTVDTIDARMKNSDSANYPMKSKPRGRAIILNIDHFSTAEHKDRYGSQFDVVNLTELFKNLHFDVKLWSNFNKQKIIEAITDEQTAAHHANADAFVMMILSHGHEGLIYAADGEPVDIEKEIVNQFSGTNCKNLINKPKMFFIQACQGKMKTLGVLADDSTESDAQTEADAKILEDLERELGGGGGEDTSDSVKARLENMTHEMADILVAYSTVPGYKAWRHTALGSWFMRDLVTVFAQYCHMEHVMDMLTRVNKLVDERVVEGVNNYRQICRHVSQFRRRVFLLPGYFNQ